MSELAAMTDRDRSLVSRIAADLVALRLLDREPRSRRLRLSWLLYTHAARVAEQRLVRRSGRLLQGLAEATGESAYAVVRSGTDAVTIAEASPPQAVVVASWVGRSWPVARSDAGPMLLAELRPAEIRKLLGERLPPSRAANAPRSVKDLLALVDAARDAGVSVLDEQADRDVASVAAPVRDHRGRMVAVIVLTGPSLRMRPRLEDLAERIAIAAATLSSELGAQVDPGDRQRAGRA